MNRRNKINLAEDLGWKVKKANILRRFFVQSSLIILGITIAGLTFAHGSSLYKVVESKVGLLYSYATDNYSVYTVEPNTVAIAHHYHKPEVEGVQVTVVDANQTATAQGEIQGQSTVNIPVYSQSSGLSASDVDRIVMFDLQNIINTGWLGQNAPQTPAPAVSQPVPISYIQPDPQNNFSGASIFAATDLSSDKFTTRLATITSLAGGGNQCLKVDNNGAVSGTGSACGSGSGSYVGNAVGSVLFVGASFDTAEDNTHFFWDDTNNRLGIGDNSPAATLTVGSGDLFQVNSAGAIAAATGITSSGTVTFSALGGGGTQCLQVDNAGVITGNGSACGTGSGGANQTPWTLDIDADGFDLKDLSNILFRETTSAPTASDVSLYRNNSGSLTANVLAAKNFNINVNGSTEYSFSSSTLDVGNNTITNAASYNGLVVTANTGVITSGVWNGSVISDAYISDTLTASNLVGSGSTSNAVDLGTAEVAGLLGSSNGGTGQNFSVSTGVPSISSGTWSVNAQLPVSLGGTGAGSFTANGILFGNGTSALQVTGAASDSILVTDGSSSPSLSQTLPLTVQSNITGLGTITSGVWNGTALSDTYVSDNLTSSIFAGSGSLTDAVDLATSEVSGVLPLINGGTGSSTQSGARINLGLGTAATYDVGSSANQVVVLNGSGKIDTTVLPSLSTSATYVVSSQASMLALSANVGDVAVRTDESKTYILIATPASNLANWQELLSPTSPVQSVAGKTGTVLLDAADITSGTFSDSRLSNNVILADGSRSFTGAPTWSGTPANGNELVTKDYADALAQGLLYKDAARVATTGNIALSGLQTIDGVTLIAGDRVLVKRQNTASQNGLYTAASGAWARTTDADTSAEVKAGLFAFIIEGTTNSDTAWVLSTNNPITLGTTALNFVQYSTATGAQKVNAGDGLVKTGNTIDVVGATNRIQVTADLVDISANYVGQTSITTLGTITTGTWNGTAIGLLYGGTGATTSQGAINNISQLTTNGDLLYNNGTNSTRLARGSNGQCLTSTTTTIQWGSCGAGGSQTPWTSAIDADAFALQDASNIEFRTAAGSAPAGSIIALYSDNSGDVTVNALTGKTFNIAVNGTDEYNFSSTGIALNGNNITGVGTNITSSSPLTITSSSSLSLASTNSSISLTPGGTGGSINLTATGFSNATTNISAPDANNKLTVQLGSGGAGKSISISTNTSGGLSALTGNIIDISNTRQLGSGTINDTAKYLSIVRDSSTYGAGASMTVSGNLVDLSSTCTQTAGTCTDTGKILRLNQGYAAASGTLLDISGAGTGNLIAADTTNASANGVSIDVQSSSSSQYALKVTSNNGATNGLYVLADGTVGIGDSTPTSMFTVGNGDLFQVNSSGAIAAATGVTSSGTITFSGLASAGTQCLQASSTGVISGTGSACGSGGGMSIGGSITSATAGSVLFAGTSGVLAQDNSNFFWDGTNSRLGLGNTSPSSLLSVGSSGQLTVNTSGNLSTSGTIATTGSGTITSANGLTNTTGALSLTGTSGSIALTGFGTTSVTSTTTTGNINTFTDAALTPPGNGSASLLNLVYSNTSSTTGSSTVNGILISATQNNSVPGPGLYQTNGINLGTITLSSCFGTCNKYAIYAPASNNWTDLFNYNGTSIINSTGQLNAAQLTGSISGITGYSQSSGTLALTTNVITGTGTSSGLSVAANSLTTGTGVNIASSSLTTGNLVNISSTSTAAASNTQTALNVTTSGTNSTSAQTTYGLKVSNTHAGTTSTNVAGYFTATGGTTANYAAIFDQGSVGIGTTTPASLLDVRGNVRIGNGNATQAGSLVIQQSDNSLSGIGLNLFNESTATNSISVVRTQGNNGSLTMQMYADGLGTGPLATAGGYLGTFSNHPIGLFTNNTERLRILSTGNVGIGDTTPASLLTVGNGDLFQVNSSGAIAAVVGITSSSNYVQSTGTMSVTSNATSGSGVNITSSTLTSGNLVNISSTSTASLSSTQTALNVTTSGTNTNAGQVIYGAKFSNAHAGPTSTNVGLYATASGGTTANYAALFDQGNVGIGTVSPAGKLEVVTAATSATSNSLLVNSGAGNASSIMLRPFANDFGSAITFNGTFDGTNGNRANTAYSSFQFVHSTSSTPNTLGLQYVAAGANPITYNSGWVLNDQGNFGIGDTTPASLLTVGNGDLFQVNSSGAIAAATGITSSGTITLSGLGGGGTQCVQVSNTGALSGAGAACGTGSGGTRLDQITAATADDTDNDNTNKQIAWDWSTLITQNAFSLTNSGTGLTSGSVLKVSTASTGAISNGLVQISGSGNYSSTGGLLNVTSTASTAGTLVNFTNNTANYTGNLLSLSATGTTTGFLENHTLGSTLTTGGLLNSTTASYNHTTTQTGKLINLAYTDASSNSSGADTTTGINLSPTLATTASSGPKTLNGIVVSPTFTSCGTTGGTCTYNGVSSTTGSFTQTTTNNFTMNGYSVSSPGALVQNTAAGTLAWNGFNITMPNITQSTGTVTSVGIKITGGTVTSGTSYAFTSDVNAGNVGIGDISPAAALTVGNGDLFQVNSSGAIAAATGVTSSGTITFSGISGSTQCLHVNASGTLTGTGSDCGSISSLPLSTVTAAVSSTSINSGANDVTWAWNSLSTGTGFTVSSSSVSSGNAMAVSVNSTAAASNTQTALNVSTAGVNSSNAQTTYGMQVTNTHTNATSGTNVGLQVSASGATTANYALLTNGGNVGIGDTTPAALLTVGNGDLFQVNSSGAIAAVAGITSSANYVQSAGTISLTSANTSQTTTNSALALNVNSLTSGTAEYIASSSLTSGTMIDLQSNGTAALTNQTGLNIAMQGTNSTSAQTTYGARIVNNHAGTTSTNIGLQVSASNGTTANYALLTNGGNVGIGDTSPASLFTVGAGDAFQINSTGAIIASTGYLQSTGTMSLTSNLTTGTGSASALYLNSASVTSGTLLNLSQATSTFSGTGLVMNFGTSSGTFSGNFADLQINGTSKFIINKGTTTASGSTAIAGVFEDLTLTNGTASGFQFGNRLVTTVNGSTAGTEVGQFIRMIDNTSLDSGQNVRGLEVQAFSGTNINGINTGIASYGYTFGIQGITTAQAAGQTTPAAIFADLDNGSDSTTKTRGNAIRAYTNDATSANLVEFYQESSAYTGTGLLMDFGNNSGSYSGNFIDLKVANVSKFSVTDGGNVTMGSTDLGNGAAGTVLTLGRNINGTATGAGSINFQSKAGTAGYVWQDNAGNLRINTSAPSNANDTAGTVIGTQTSTRDTKQDITDYTDFAEALQMVADMPLHTFRYIKDVQGYGEDSPLAKTRLGYIADEVPGIFMWGNSIDQVSVNGILLASVKELNTELQDLKMAQPNLADAPLVVKSHLYLSEDSVGEAKILTGVTSVRIVFVKPYEYQPIVTATPEDRVGSEYWISDKDDSGFTINIAEAADHDVTFDWHSFAGELAKLTVSDGTKGAIELVIHQEPEAVQPDQTVEAPQEPSSDNPEVLGDQTSNQDSTATPPDNSTAETGQSTPPTDTQASAE